MKQCSCPTAYPSALSAKVSICAEAPANGADFREQNSNYHQLEKLKNEMICLVRRRKCGLNHIEEEQQRNQPFLSFPTGGPILSIFCVVRRSRTSRYASLLNALNMVKIDYAQVMLV